MLPALDDAEEELAGRARLGAAFGGPAQGALDGGAQLARGAGVRRAIVEDHGNVGPQRLLDGHDFRAEKQQRAIQVRAELDAVGVNLANRGQAEHLETAAVSEYRQRPVHKPVQPAGGADDVETGAKVEVIGVAEEI